MPQAIGFLIWVLFMIFIITQICIPIATSRPIFPMRRGGKLKKERGAVEEAVENKEFFEKTEKIRKENKIQTQEEN